MPRDSYDLPTLDLDPTVPLCYRSPPGWRPYGWADGCPLLHVTSDGLLVAPRAAPTPGGDVADVLVVMRTATWPTAADLTRALDAFGARCVTPRILRATCSAVATDYAYAAVLSFDAAPISPAKRAAMLRTTLVPSCPVTGRRAPR